MKQSDYPTRNPRMMTHAELIARVETLEAQAPLDAYEKLDQRDATIERLRAALEAMMYQFDTDEEDYDCLILARAALADGAK